MFSFLLSTTVLPWITVLCEPAPLWMPSSGRTTPLGLPTPLFWMRLPVLAPATSMLYPQFPKLWLPMIRLSRPPSMRIPRLKPLTRQFLTSAPTAPSRRIPYHAPGFPDPVTLWPAQSRTPETTVRPGEDAHTPTSAVSVVGPATMSPHRHGTPPPQFPPSDTVAQHRTNPPQSRFTNLRTTISLS